MSPAPRAHQARPPPVYRTIAKAIAREPRWRMVGAAFAVRLAWVLIVPTRPVGDFALYWESAAHLVAHGELDAEFIYMPGYVFLLAVLQALGGGLLAAKLVGVFAGTAVALAAGAIAHALFGRSAGRVATGIAAFWPAGIAVASVTGTDMPAAALVALAVMALVALGPRRPWLAAIASGAIFGVAAWVRAVAVPLALLSALYWAAQRSSLRLLLARTLTSGAVAALILLPWGIRNRQVTGELFLTDSHGGHTALVGANPNSEGAYSRSLNVMFEQVTGYRLFEVPARQRESDRAAYALARDWARFSPAYALGLIGAKADRLLAIERNLLYWPLYRESVLPSGKVKDFFDTHRGALEALCDGTWWAIVALAAAGLALTVRQRRFAALSVVAFPVALIAIYTVFFSEVRYHVAIAPLLFPFSAHAAVWFTSLAARRFPRSELVAASVALGAAALTFATWHLALTGARRLRERHRWAATVCHAPAEGGHQAPGQATPRICAWRSAGISPFPHSPVRGVWDGVGLALRSSIDSRADARSRLGDAPVAATTTLLLPGGRYRISGDLTLSGGQPGDTVSVMLSATDRVIVRTILGPASRDNLGDVPPKPGSSAFSTVAAEGVIDHDGGLLTIRLGAHATAGARGGGAPTVWLTRLRVERFFSL